MNCDSNCSVTSFHFAMTCFIKAHMTLELDRPRYIQNILCRGCFKNFKFVISNLFRTHTQKKSLLVAASEVFPSGRILCISIVAECQVHRLLTHSAMSQRLLTGGIISTLRGSLCPRTRVSLWAGPPRVGVGEGTCGPGRSGSGRPGRLHFTCPSCCQNQS